MFYPNSLVVVPERRKKAYRTTPQTTHIDISGLQGQINDLNQEVTEIKNILIQLVDLFSNLPSNPIPSDTEPLPEPPPPVAPPVEPKPSPEPPTEEPTIIEIPVTEEFYTAINLWLLN